MRTDLSIQTNGAGMLIRVEAPMDLLRIVLTLAGGGLFLYFASRSSEFGGWISLAVVAILGLAVMKEVYAGLRGTDVELAIENLNFSTSGHAPGGYIPGYVAREDLISLAFREREGGGEDEERPRGLYADYSSDSPNETRLCLLPHINKEQSEEVIQAIRQRFPEVEKLTSGRFPKGGLISLNLD